MDSAAHSTRIGRNLEPGSVPACPNCSRPKTIAKEFDRSSRSANRTSQASERDQVSLSQDKTFVALSRYFCALRAIGGGRVCVKQERARLAFNVSADEPSVGTAQQRATADLGGVRHPRIFRLRCGGDARVAFFANIANTVRDPLDDRLGANGVVTERGIGGDKEVRKSGRHQLQVRAHSIGPFFLETLTALAAKIDPRHRSGDRVEAGRVDDNVELVFAIAGLDAFGRDALDWSLLDTDQLNVVAVVSLVVFGFQRHALGAERMILGRQLFCDRGILHARADLLAHKLGEVLVGNAVGHDVPEVAQPFAEPRPRPQLLVHRSPFLAREIEGRAPIEFMEKSAGSFFAPFVNLGIGSLEAPLSLVINQRVSERWAVVRRALEDRKMADFFGDDWDHLDRGSAGADDCDPLAGEIDLLLLLRPPRGV